MEIRINLNGKKRKDLAAAVGELLHTEPVYRRPPSYAYDIGEVTLTQNNSLIFSTKTNPETVQYIISHLQDQGFTVDNLPDKPAIEMPIDGFDEIALDNLRKLVAAKAELIKKALGTTDLPIQQTNEAICFPWFAFDTPSEDIAAYTQFISALCDMAKKQKRVLATEKSVENEKYSFRCFLLRLGFIGDEYASTRRVLLRNLIGNGSVKSEKGEKAEKSQSGQAGGQQADSRADQSAIPSGLPVPSATAFEESAEAIGKHLLRGLIQYLETIL